MAPIAAKMPKVLAVTVERMRGFIIIDYASSWADQVPSLMGGVPEGRAAEHLKDCCTYITCSVQPFTEAQTAEL